MTAGIGINLQGEIILGDAIITPLAVTFTLRELLVTDCFGKSNAMDRPNSITIEDLTITNLTQLGAAPQWLPRSRFFACGRSQPDFATSMQTTVPESDC